MDGLTTSKDERMVLTSMGFPRFYCRIFPISTYWRTAHAHMDALLALGIDGMHGEAVARRRFCRAVKSAECRKESCPVSEVSRYSRDFEMLSLDSPPHNDQPRNPHFALLI